MKVISKDDLASLIDVAKLKEVLGEKMDAVSSVVKKEEPKTSNWKQIVKVTLIVVGVVAAICGAAYAIYRYFTPDYDDEFDDDFDDAFEDDEEDDLFDEDKE